MSICRFGMFLLVFSWWGVLARCRTAVLSFIGRHDLAHLLIVYVILSDALNLVHSLDWLRGEILSEVLIHKSIGQAEARD